MRKRTLNVNINQLYKFRYPNFQQVKEKKLTRRVKKLGSNVFDFII